MTRRSTIPPACPVYGASLPHSNPIAWQYHDQIQYKQLFDEAVTRATALHRPFEDFEVFGDIWETGIELIPQMDERFVLVKEATPTSRRLWGLKPQEREK